MTGAGAAAAGNGPGARVEAALGHELTAAPGGAPEAAGRMLPLLRRAALRVLEDEGVTDAELSVTLLADSEIAELNLRYLEHDGPTDVLSFPLPGEGAPLVGDVYIGYDQAARQAVELGVPHEEELVRLVVHGTLHVLGHEHPEGGPERERSSMWGRQERLVRRIMDAADRGGGDA